MEPNKLENQIREKLNSHEIQPSLQAWDRLDAMLSVAENKKPKKRFAWLYIAASIVGFVFFGLIFYNQESKNVKTNNQTVVEVNNDEKSTLSKEIIQSSSKSNWRTEEAIKKHLETIKNNKEEVLAIVERKKELNKVTNSNKRTQELVYAQTENKEIVTEVISQKIEEKTKTEIDSNTLLTSVETNKENKLNKSKQKLRIDPSALLSQVDSEEELTFKQKAFKKISKKLETTKEAVASRNQEQQSY